MGRVSKGSTNTAFRVQYRKLVDDYSTSGETIKLMSTTSSPTSTTPSSPTPTSSFPTTIEYLAYPCCQCGHTLQLKAEELNSIVGNAFRLAYAAQLHQPSLQGVIANQLQQHQSNPDNKSFFSTDGSCFIWSTHLLSTPTTTPHAITKMDVPTANSTVNSLESNANMTKNPPTSIPGLHTFNIIAADNVAEDNVHKVNSVSQQSTPSSEESNSPTELNSYKRLVDKPPLIKRIAMGITNAGGNFMSHTNGENTDDDSWPLMTSMNSPNSSACKTPFYGFINEIATENNEIKSENNNTQAARQLEIDNNKLSQNSTDIEFKSKRISQISSSSSAPTESSILGSSTPTPPPLPERTDSLHGSEEDELRVAPWFQSGIPREIALEVLIREPIGTFIVRESSSVLGCYALSVRVPFDCKVSGVAHYIIARSKKGYQIRGCLKEFPSITALIVHHSVMKEILPIPLALSRYKAPKRQRKQDFVDINIDPEYSRSLDFRKMLEDVKSENF